MLLLLLSRKNKTKQYKLSTMKNITRNRKVNSRSYKRKKERRVSEWVKKYHRGVSTSRIAWINRYDVIPKIARICKLKT